MVKTRVGDIRAVGPAIIGNHLIGDENSTAAIFGDRDFADNDMMGLCFLACDDALIADLRFDVEGLNDHIPNTSRRDIDIARVIHHDREGKPVSLNDSDTAIRVRGVVFDQNGHDSARFDPEAMVDAGRQDPRELAIQGA